MSNTEQNSHTEAAVGKKSLVLRLPSTTLYDVYKRKSKLRYKERKPVPKIVQKLKI